MSLYVGAIYGGPELEDSLVERLQEKITALVRKHDPGMDEAALDIVFHVPGSVLKPEFEGVRSGSLSRKKKMLQMQIAVPENLLNNELRLKSFLIQSIRRAISEGAAILKRKSFSFSAEENLAVIDRVESAI